MGYGCEVYPTSEPQGKQCAVRPTAMHGALVGLRYSTGCSCVAHWEVDATHWIALLKLRGR